MRRAFPLAFALLAGACAESARPTDGDPNIPDGGAAGSPASGGSGSGGEAPAGSCEDDCAGITAPKCFAARCDFTGRACEVVPSPSGAPCDDDLFCTVHDACDGDGHCTQGAPNDCGLSLDQCEVAVCDEAAQSCTPGPKPDGAECTSTDLCIASAACAGGECVTTPLNCFFMPTSDECHVGGSCNPITGECEEVPGNDGGDCEDGDLCTHNDACLDGICQAGYPPDCGDHNAACTVGVCEPATGLCIAQPFDVGDSCAMPNLDSCHMGACTAGGVCEVSVTPGANCHPGDTCLAGTCDSVGTCVYVSQNEGTSCDDFNPCTTSETCSAGVCGGALIDGCISTGRLAMNATHSCLITSGNVMCWGSNEFGKLGTGTQVDSAIPVPAEGIAAPALVATGFGHTCAILGGGSVKCWGYNNEGELGNDSYETSLVPVAVNVTGATKISAGLTHTCVLTAGGGGACWGDNGIGQLGNGTTLFAQGPQVVDGLSGAMEIAAGAIHTCVLMTGGTVKCWGYGSFGQLGHGTTHLRDKPNEVPGVSGAVAIAAGGYHSCAVVAGGTVQCWGAYPGTGLSAETLVPVTVSGVSGAVQIAAGGGHTCVIVDGGTVQCWGANDKGQLGNGSTTQSLSPVSVTLPASAISIAASDYQTCAGLEGGGVQCWGSNFFGQLGDGTKQDRPTPVAVSGVP